MDKLLGLSLAVFAVLDLTVVVVILVAVFRAHHARQMVKRQLVASIAFVLIFFVVPLIFLTAMYANRARSSPAAPAATR